ncbi:MAG TPA: glutamate racemase [Candidatus Gastranaerophilales bacterium]|nr:glutamate racemase [Candidatus Gastranaerophilales bacterium]
MSNNPIGVFDSGVGGLTVLKELVNLLPNENYLYFGDTARIPYGEKTQEQLFCYARGIMEWFKSRNVKAVVMACNTSSAVVYDTIKNDYNFPVFSLIEPTAEYISYVNSPKIGVLATSATVNSRAYSKAVHKINPSKEIIEVACPGLVELVENNKTDTYEAKKLVIKYVAPLLEKRVGHIILGCTHYPYLSNIIADVTNDKEMLVNPAKFLGEKVVESLLSNDLLNAEALGSRQYFASSNTAMFVEAGKRFYPDIEQAQELVIGEVSSIIK